MLGINPDLLKQIEELHELVEKLPERVFMRHIERRLDALYKIPTIPLSNEFLGISDLITTGARQ